MPRQFSVPIIAAGFGLLLGSALPAFAENSQQTKMTTCNADASSKGLTGDDRKTYMKACLSADPTPATTGSNLQQTKMKTCNADANSKGLKGDDRKVFMKTCLSAGN